MMANSSQESEKCVTLKLPLVQLAVTWNSEPRPKANRWTQTKICLSSKVVDLKSLHGDIEWRIFPINCVVRTYEAIGFLVKQALKNYIYMIFDLFFSTVLPTLPFNKRKDREIKTGLNLYKIKLTVTGRLDTKSFRYKLEQWNYINFDLFLRMVGAWKKISTLGEYSSFFKAKFRETIYHSTE